MLAVVIPVVLLVQDVDLDALPVVLQRVEDNVMDADLVAPDHVLAVVPVTAIPRVLEDVVQDVLPAPVVLGHALAVRIRAKALVQGHAREAVITVVQQVMQWK